MTFLRSLPRALKLFVLLSITSLFVYCGVAYAQTPLDQFLGKLHDTKMNPTRWTNSMIENVAGNIAVAIVGECADCPSAVSMMGSTMAWMHGTMPASSELYLADIGSSLGIVKPVYAQGTGFTSLRNLKVISEVFRNIMLVLYIVIFLVVGFMIMFRFRIDPRTVVTVQNALPRLVLTFVLVWLAYPISGLLIDLMYVVSFLFFGIFQAIGLDVSGFSSHYQGETVMQFWYFGIGFEAVWRSASSVAHLIAQILGGGVTGSVSSGIAWVLAWLIVAVAILFAVFRTFFQLLMSYIMVIMGVIFAPLWIGFGGIPIPLGSIGFGGWLRHMLGHLAPFPVTAGLYLIAAAIMQGTGGSPAASEGWVAPLIGAGYGPAVIQALVGLGMILLTPVVVQMTKDFFKSPEFKYMAAIQQGIGTGRAVALSWVSVPSAMAIHTLQWRGGEWIGEKLGFLKGRTDYPPPSGEKREEHP